MKEKAAESNNNTEGKTPLGDSKASMFDDYEADFNREDPNRDIRREINQFDFSQFDQKKKIPITRKEVIIEKNRSSPEEDSPIQVAR